MCTITNNENLVQCAKCGGHCCKNMPCEVSVKDVFGDKTPTYELLKVWFEENPLYCVDWWDGPVNEEAEKLGIVCCFYIRPKQKGVDDFFHASRGGECVFLTENGCSLSWEKRPFGGKSLVPGPFIPEQIKYGKYSYITIHAHYDCKSNYSKKEAAIEWLPYYDWFLSLLHSR